MSGPNRAYRVAAFADWLDTIPPDPPFHTRPAFRFFADLSGAEIDAAAALMRQRAAAAFAEAERLERELLERGRP